MSTSSKNHIGGTRYGIEMHTFSKWKTQLESWGGTGWTFHGAIQNMRVLQSQGGTPP